MASKIINNPWKILSSKSVYLSPFLEIFEDEVINPQGQPIIHNVITDGHNSDGGVCILPMTEKGIVYLVRQFRYALGNFSLEVPSGRIDHGVDPLIAAKGELAEEAGLVASTWRLVGSTHIGTESIKQKSYIYFATDLVENRRLRHFENLMTVKKLSLEKAVDSVLTGKICHTASAYTILLIHQMLSARRLLL